MSRFAYSIFCDDMRNEVNNKVSLMGLYSTELLLKSFPMSLPRFTIVMHAFTDIDQPFKEISFIGRLSGVEIFRIDIPNDHLKIGQPGVFTDADSKRIQVQTMANIIPAQFDAPGKLDVDVIADGEKIYCSGLKIGLAPADMVL
jgi:hypothetical protein